MSWEEVAKEMEGVEGVISMMEEAIEEDEEGKKDDNDGEQDDSVKEEERGLQSLLLSEILQFRTSQLRRVKVGEEKVGEERVVKVGEGRVVESEETLTDISPFTTDSGSGFMVSNQVSQCFEGIFQTINA